MFLQNKNGAIDRAWSPRLFSFNNMMRAKTSIMDFDLAWVGLTRPRWARLLNQYVSREDLLKFLDLCTKAPRGASVGLNTRRTEHHTWGPCLMGLAFTPMPNPSLSVFSRASSFAQTGVIDLALVSVLARTVSKLCDIPTRVPVAINWYCAMLYLSAWHIIPYLTAAERLDEMLNDTDPEKKLFAYVRRLYQNYFIERKTTNYGPAQRMISRHDSLKAGTLKSVPVNSLSLSTILLKGDVPDEILL